MSGVVQSTQALPRVLVVDDNEMSRMVLEHRVKQLGYDAASVASGQEALEVLQGDEFDLVLLDIIMDGMDGKQVLGWLRDEGKIETLPVIVVSGMDDLAERQECLTIGARDFLHKPVNAEDLSEAMAMWLPAVGKDDSVASLDTSSATGVPFVDPDNVQVFDPAAIEGLRKDFGEQVAGSFITKFQSLAPGLFNGVTKSSKGGEIAEWRHAAHDLKGGARTMGLMRLAAVARNIEQACHENRIADATASTELLEVCAAEGMAALKQFVSGD